MDIKIDITSNIRILYVYYFVMDDPDKNCIIQYIIVPRQKMC